jgi:hypothetical protein
MTAAVFGGLPLHRAVEDDVAVIAGDEDRPVEPTRRSTSLQNDAPELADHRVGGDPRFSGLRGAR